MAFLRFSDIRTLLNMAMCSIMLLVSSVYPSDLYAMEVATRPLVLYCLLDLLSNSWDMIAHHTATLITIFILSSIYPNQNDISKAIVAKTFIEMEISTLFLDLIHLRYRQLSIMLAFIFTFFHYRVIRPPQVLVLDESTSYWSGAVCGSDQVCNTFWVASTLTLMSLNIYWFTKIPSKILRK